MTDRRRFHGAMTALVTPFLQGQIDWPALERLIELQVAGGIQGLVPCGTTGESPTLTPDEHCKVIEFVVERVAGRVPVIAGTGSNSTAEAIDLTRHARQAGADGCLVVNPYYNRPTQQGMFAHVAVIAEVGLPIVLYNHPGRTGVELTVETIARMYEEIPMVVAIKDATLNLNVASATIAACGITVLCGEDALTLPIGSIGGQGVISVVANLVPARMRGLCDAIARNDLAAAQAQHRDLFPLFRAMNLEINPIPVKAALAMTGLIHDQIRLPLTPLTEGNRATLARILEQYGLVQ